ncbi:Activin receptor type-1 [Geodia barretti]|uniref:receptor protein serine/threonine kinase n=1 Tax=Geodia barretti TaxID=519541 RepID=A0AA35T2Z2_GEOBA|nr:Activin receptor type-1 [Geodia barretti]
MMGSWLDLDCNFTLPQPSLSLSLTHTLLDLPSTATPSPPGDSLSLSKPQVYAMAGMLGLVCVCLVVAVVVIIYVWCKRNERHKTASLGSLPTFEDDLLETTNMTSGSGSGQRLLEQRTIARQIKKIEIVGKGRYGEVWLGEWGGESVAIKIFTSQDEDSWAREGEVYGTYMLHHDNIAKFIACDKRPLNLGFELWMVMEYHHNGSLLDFLLIHSLTAYQAQRFVYSIASGLHYLHVDIQTGAQIKPGIAHRDLKSKNILVKSDHSCCISDFGLAVRHVGATGHVDISSINPRQGTKRYMAPEILDGSINYTKFDSYKMVDMYCFGLIIWEVARRTSNRAEEYQLPYFQHVSHDPSMDDMRKVVCTDSIRPTIASWWSEDEVNLVCAQIEMMIIT